MKIQRSQNFIQTEMERFNEGLSRCVLSCQDDARDNLSSNSTAAEQDAARADFEACAIRCCDKNIEKLPSIGKKMRVSLESGKF